MNAEAITDFIKAVLGFELFYINKTPVTILSIIIFAAILIAFLILSRMFRRGLELKILSRLQIDTGTRYTLSRLIHYFIMVVGAIVAFQVVGIDLGGLAVVFGLLSVGIGFGLQNVTSNFIAGLILLLERPIKVGDRVTIGDTVGYVSAINIRSTMITSLNNISIIVPNSEFVSSRVVNWSHGDPRVRLDIAVGVSYNSDLDTVMQALQEVALENPKILEEPKPEVLLSGFGDSSWNMELRVWLRGPEQYFRIRSEVNTAIVRKFREYKIEIPFPQRDLHIRSPLPVPFQSGSDAMPPEEEQTKR